MKTLATIFAATVALGGSLPQIGSGESLTSSEKRKRKEDWEEERNKKRGLKKFRFGDNTLWALNEKSARKKAKKKGWL